jgi:hypothetical protein
VGYVPTRAPLQVPSARVDIPGRGPGPSPREHAALMALAQGRVGGGSVVESAGPPAAVSAAVAAVPAPSVAQGNSNNNPPIPSGFETVFGEGAFERAVLGNQFPSMFHPRR